MSFDEANELLKNWLESVSTYIDHDKKQENSGCQHEFQDYSGFTESYQFCKKCDHKRFHTDKNQQ
jgi:hypothetical protein